ncbi:unnamed protein product [Blepharisma stoltei]|uniref:Tetratricopeptide repeat protein n=1 Tax=Blepharisma stoltei TaxID=1481888 RepID=A0AAU9K9H2_9CILI|nr:unnamed protein product [Blepharisma stoltei]
MNKQGHSQKSSQYSNRALEETQKRTEIFLKKFIRKKSESSPDNPIPFTKEDYETIKVLITNLNNFGVELSQENRMESYKLAYQLFIKAEKLGLILSKKISMLPENSFHSQSVAKLRSLTYNNLGCYFKSRDKLVTAFEFLEKAMQIEKQAELGDFEIATTYLNICSVLSKLNRHEEALMYSEESVVLLEKADEEEERNPEEVAKFLATAYKVYAEELEFMSRIKESKILLQKAYETSREILGENNPLTQNLAEKYENFKNNYEDDLMNFPKNKEPFIKNRQDLDALSNIPSYKSIGTAEFGNERQESLRPNKQALGSPLNVPSYASLAQVELSNDKQSREIVVLAQSYRVFLNERHKVIILDKEEQENVKILVVPKTKFPIYRVSVSYADLNDLLRMNIRKTPLLIEKEELRGYMEELMNLLYIDGGKLKIHHLDESLRESEINYVLSKNSRPGSASRKFMTFTTEKQGAKYSVTMAVPEENKVDTWKQKYIPSFDLDEQL